MENYTTAANTAFPVKVAREQQLSLSGSPGTPVDGPEHFILRSAVITV